ncbi:MAG: AEC family transporter, partial [Rhodocyclaceae bacterium]|nr:AEC family transporter [Rhodocyclaceae bacterium]
LAVPAQSFLTRLADASIALGLLAVGAALRWGQAGGRWTGSVWIMSVKLLCLPAVVWFVGPWLGLSGAARDVAVIFAALPSASSAYILAMRMGGDGPGVAWLISATTLLAVPTLTFWLGLLRG